MEFAEATVLGSLVGRLPPAERDSAWRAAGRALAAVHAVDATAARAAGCEEVGIDASASRGSWHAEMAVSRLEQLRTSRPDLPDTAPLVQLVEDARPLAAHAPLALCQFDVHLWQFVLAPRNGAWECTAILDWENADLDDPDWDLAMMDGFRFEAVGPTPGAFFSGYGREPGELYRVYRLERAAWILHHHARGQEWLALSVPLAEAYLRGVIREVG